jgi:hypothetical protein
MRTNRIRRSRKKLVIAVSALVIAAAPFVGSGAWGDPPAGGPSGGDQKIRKLQEKEFLQEHSDASGKPRPDLWRKGVEQQKQMQVAPYIGWHPSSKKSDGSASTSIK